MRMWFENGILCFNVFCISVIIRRLYLNLYISRQNAIYTFGSSDMNFDRALLFERFLKKEEKKK